MEFDGDPAMEIASEALKQMLEKRAELAEVKLQSARLDLAIAHQHKVVQRLRGSKAPKPRQGTNLDKILEQLVANERGLTVETVSRLTDIKYDNAAAGLARLVLMGWAIRVRKGFYRAS